jgi:predicted flap endonuclease-1-like 5' DNA nuclease
LFAPISSSLAAAPTISWWVWLLIIVLIILLILLLWWLFKKDRSESTSTTEPVHETPQPVETRSISVPMEPAVPDDIKIIEGIGPKIEKILNEAGIHTCATLASSEVSHLEGILKAANLRLADPTTWPEQARLAAEGKMEELQTLQGQLKGGRKVY